MGHDELLIDHGVVGQQVGVAGIVVDDHFVDLAQAIGVLLAQALEFHSKPPMRIALRESAVGGDLVDLVVVQHFEARLKEVQFLFLRILLDNLSLFGEFPWKGMYVRCDRHSNL